MKGETKKAESDTQQTQNSNVSSTGAEESTSQTPQTFTKEEVQKQISDALAKVGREAKAIETAKKDIEAREVRLKVAEQAREDAELDGAINEVPEGERESQRQTLKTYKDKLRADRQALTEREKTLAIKEAEWEDSINEAQELKFEMMVFEIAGKNGVSAEVLKDKAAKLKITDENGIEELALVMPKKTDVLPPDSGKTAGGGIDLDGMSPSEKIAYGLRNKK